MRRSLLLLILLAVAVPLFGAANLTGKMTVVIAHSYPGLSAIYQLDITNSGDALTTASIDLPLPSQLTGFHQSGGPGSGGCSPNDCFWNGDVPAGSTVSITFDTFLRGTPGDVVSVQGVIHYDSTTTVTDDPATPASHDPTSFTIMRAAFRATKSTPKKSYFAGEPIPYTITVTNIGNQDSLEISMVILSQVFDFIPTGVHFISGTARFGTVVYPSLNAHMVGWYGTIAPGATVTITINVRATVTGMLANQARVNDTVTEIAFEDTDDPSTPAVKDPTVVEIVAAPIPALSPVALALLAGALALIASKLLSTSA